MSRAPERLAAIIDTNVVLDIYLFDALDKAYGKAGEGLDSREAFFRRVRARESPLLAWYFHSTGSITLALHHEPGVQMVKQAGPKTLGLLASQQAQISIYFVKDYVLNRWNDKYEPNSDAGLSGEDCDNKLLDLAALHRAPLITNEGYTVDGVTDASPTKLRRKGKKRSILVQTPREFWTGKMGERACKKFITRFDSQAPKYLRDQGRSAAATRAVDIRRAFLMHVFFGIASNDRAHRSPSHGASSNARLPFKR